MKIGVIVPTVNEEGCIEQCITFIKRYGGDHLVEPLIVVDGGSTDATVSRAEKAGARVLSCAIQSRAAQMNLGASFLQCDIFYFVHADVKLIPSFSVDILAAIQDGFDAGCFRYAFDSPKKILRLNAYFNRFNGIMCRGGDQTLFVRKSVFEALNGFDEYYSIMEDYDFVIRLRKRYSFKIIPKKILVSARKYDENSWLRVQFANSIVFLLFIFKRSPTELKQIYKKLLNYRPI